MDKQKKIDRAIQEIKKCLKKTPLKPKNPKKDMIPIHIMQRAFNMFLLYPDNITCERFMKSISILFSNKSILTSNLSCYKPDSHTIEEKNEMFSKLLEKFLEAYIILGADSLTFEMVLQAYTDFSTHQNNKYLEESCKNNNLYDNLLAS